MKKRRTWRKPELIVLVRGKHEEKVFQACKGTSLYNAPTIEYSACIFNPPQIVGACDPCYTIVQS